MTEVSPTEPDDELTTEQQHALDSFAAGWFAKSDPGAFALAVSTWKASR